MAKDLQVIEGETVEEGNEAGSNAQILVNMESLIKSHISAIDKLSVELKKHKEMLDDIFDSDPTYKEHSDKAKEAAKIKSATKAQILKKPQAADLDKKIREFKAQLKENQESLSDYLQEYARMSGVNEIEGEDGEVREIVYVAKLIRRPSLPR